MYVFVRGVVGGAGGEWVTGLGLGFTNSESGICVRVLVAVVWVVLEENAWATMVWDGDVVCCESGLSVLMAGPGICILA